MIEILPDLYTNKHRTLKVMSINKIKKK